ELRQQRLRAQRSHRHHPGGACLGAARVLPDLRGEPVMRGRAALGLLCLSVLPAFAGGTLVGVARIPAAAVDSQGETLGGFGSGMMLVPGSWRHKDGHYTAKVLMLPDRGWNTAGTT